MGLPGKKRPAMSHDIHLLEVRREERALHLFTNRDDERDILKQFFQTISDDDSQLEQPVLSFWGVGGIGKSSLLKRVWKEFQETNPHSQMKLIHLDLDADKYETIAPIELFWKLRLMIHEQARVPFFLFDLLYLKYKQLNNEPVDMNPTKNNPILTSLESLAGGSDIAASVIDSISGYAAVTQVGALLGKFSNYLFGKKRQHNIADKFGVRLADIHSFDMKALERLMPRVFTEELGLSLLDVRNKWYHRDVTLKGMVNYHPTLCIAVDGYERVSSPVEKTIVESLILPCFENDDFYPHIGFLFFGREMLDWSPYHDELQEVAEEGRQWETYIDSHRLGGLNRKYVEQFLGAAISLYKKEGQDLWASTIEKYRNHIAEVTKEESADGQDAYHPFYLDLCLEMIEKQGENFDPDKHLGKTPKDLIQRFLKYMDDSTREWCRAFALAGEFDEEVFEYLVDAKSISGNLQSFYRFVTQYSYITPQQDTASYRFHRLMQESLIADITTKSERERSVLIKSVVSKLMDFYDEKFSDRKLESLTDIDIEYYERANTMLEASVSAKLMNVTDAYGKFHAWDDAFKGLFFEIRVPRARQWLARMRELLGEKHPGVATSMNNLALILESEGSHEDAEKLYRQSLEMMRELLGEKHPDVATSMNNLAGVLESEGSYEDAENLYRQSLKMRRELLGEKHPDVATGLNNLGCCLESEGKYCKAEQLHHESLVMRQELLGDKHPDVADSLNNLASVLDSQGNYTEAETLYRESLKMTKKLFGDKHPHVAIRLNNLAFALEKQGKYCEAEQLHRESLKLRKELLGEKHPSVADSLNNLASVLDSQGNYSEAEAMFRESLAIMKELFGDKHLSVATRLNNLAYALGSQGNYSEAEALFRESLVMMKELLGEKHPSAIGGLNNLASILNLQGNYSEAEALFRESLVMMKELLGEKHPDVAISMNNLASALGSQGNYSEAEAMFRESLAMMQELLGDEHPDVASSLNNLAGVLDSQGKYAEAEHLYLESLKLRKELLGEKHPDVATSMNNLAFVFNAQGSYEDAEKLYRQSLEMMRELLGDKHPDVASSMKNLVVVLQSQGKDVEAKALENELE